MSPALHQIGETNDTFLPRHLSRMPGNLPLRRSFGQHQSAHCRLSGPLLQQPTENLNVDSQGNFLLL